MSNFDTLGSTVFAWEWDMFQKFWDVRCLVPFSRGGGSTRKILRLVIVYHSAKFSNSS